MNQVRILYNLFAINMVTMFIGIKNIKLRLKKINSRKIDPNRFILKQL